jgi:hypothetical protein
MLDQKRSDVGVVADPVTSDPGVDEGQSEEEDEQKNPGVSMP